MQIIVIIMYEYIDRILFIAFLILYKFSMDARKNLCKIFINRCNRNA